MNKTARARAILGCLHRAAAGEGGLTDGQLLGRFIARRDDAAFTALVRRHGPMVLAVCRRILRHTQEAEDAFQAAFLVLARKAAALSDREAVGGWLHGVACRVAWAARATALRRRAKEQQVKDMPQAVASPPEEQRELLELLDRELARLPDKYRLPVVLCELEGRSRREAALQLGLPEGTLSSRLSRARSLLAARLGRRGLAVTGAVVGLVLAKEAGAAGVPGPLTTSTVRAMGGSATAAAAALAEGVMKAMLLSKLTGAAWGLLLAASLSVGAVAWTYQAAAAQQPATPTRALPPPAAPPAADRDELEALRLEVEELRAGLQATRQRVQTLEKEVQTRKTQAMPEMPGVVPEAPMPLVTAGPEPRGLIVAYPAPTTANPDGASVRTRTPAPSSPFIAPMGAAVPATATLPKEEDLMAVVEAAAQRLKEKPTDPQAQAAFECAVQRLNAWARQQHPGPPGMMGQPGAK